MKARIPQHREFIINFPDTVDQAKANEGWAKLQQIVLETDCPYMAPEPVRGTRCDSSLIRYVGEYIAQIKGVREEAVFRQTAENAKQVYQL